MSTQQQNSPLHFASFRSASVGVMWDHAIGLPVTGSTWPVIHDA